MSIPIDNLQLSKKWTLGGFILLLSAFFLHPETCFNSIGFLTYLVPASWADKVTYIAGAVGAILAVLGQGLFHPSDK